LPVLEKAFADARVYHTTQAAQRPVEVQVSDAAVAPRCGWPGKTRPIFGFTLLEMYKVRGPEARQLATGKHLWSDRLLRRRRAPGGPQKAREWLAKHVKENPRQTNPELIPGRQVRRHERVLS